MRIHCVYMYICYSIWYCPSRNYTIKQFLTRYIRRAGGTQRLNGIPEVLVEMPSMILPTTQPWFCSTFITIYLFFLIGIYLVWIIRFMYRSKYASQVRVYKIIITNVSVSLCLKYNTNDSLWVLNDTTANTVKPVCNDHLYTKINYLWLSQ